MSKSTVIGDAILLGVSLTECLWAFSMSDELCQWSRDEASRASESDSESLASARVWGLLVLEA